jgi:hypothetical protein
LISKLTEIPKKARVSKRLSNFTTVFKLGLFTNAVFDEEPLMLMDLPNLSAAIFERFNQL